MTAQKSMGVSMASLFSIFFFLETATITARATTPTAPSMARAMTAGDVDEEPSLWVLAVCVSWSGAGVEEDEEVGAAVVAAGIEVNVKPLVPELEL